MIWEGAEYRGRSRQVVWQGACRLAGNRFERVQGFNFFNQDKPLLLAANGSSVSFDNVTTGNFSGFDLWLEDADAGELTFTSGPVEAQVKIADIGLDDTVFAAGGLGKGLRLFRLPDTGKSHHLTFRERVRLAPGKDNPLYVRVTQEDGHQAWSSPIYLIPEHRPRHAGGSGGRQSGARNAPKGPGPLARGGARSSFPTDHRLTKERARRCCAND
ncbi:MAG: hypothetical protein R3D25_00200 [Geminicoccaceae bacterium]